ncbi:hypothetical protein [Psychrobacillus psychrodurans]|uniref:hypothetical protein n=1 Tax=Psychrobacillus psychrodurans TaxID=126157 RepID=UPI0008E11281|nr:hypothetical protein [Psychrobacillus psychrodurans]MCZ8540796.1 hypothetical protein [Psychrobacillus psychrodurans]SFM75859.1 hypothetical protein SAMN05421832_106146 [Psychrobacillus psychrodurans]
MEAKKKFLIELHSIIKERSMIGNLISNPPLDSVLEEFNLTVTELNALKAQQFTPESISGIEKIVRDNLMTTFFEVFCILDGVGDPNESFSLMEPDEVWLGLKLTEVEYNEEEEEVTEFLHDEFFSTYQEWKELQRKN